MLTKGIVILFLLIILYSLGSALYYLMRDHSSSTQVVKALSYRIALSVILFVFLLIAYGLGWITPHSV